MTWWDKIFLAVYFGMIIMVQCLWQYSLIKNGRPINHFKHGSYYALTILPVLYFFSPLYWQVITIALLERAAFFDPVLNLLRKKSFYYNGAGGSWIDRLENRLSSWWLFTLKIMYIIFFVTVFILIQ